mmetsp:Transcript_36427/g.89707  ORF Transcript_36427/g.89707 Transcript_36427/m.89707 type:complete len:260 (-) Transcript_36427:662-1441(-)
MQPPLLRVLRRHLGGDHGGNIALLVFLYCWSAKDLVLVVLGNGRHDASLEEHGGVHLLCLHVAEPHVEVDKALALQDDHRPGELAAQEAHGRVFGILPRASPRHPQIPIRLGVARAQRPRLWVDLRPLALLVGPKVLGERVHVRHGRVVPHPRRRRPLLRGVDGQVLGGRPVSDGDDGVLQALGLGVRGMLCKESRGGEQSSLRDQRQLGAQVVCLGLPRAGEGREGVDGGVEVPCEEPLDGRHRKQLVVPKVGQRDPR